MTPCLFSDHNGIKLGINNREIGKLTNTLKLNSTQTTNQVKKKIKEKIRKYFKAKTKHIKTYEMQ